MIGNLGLHRDFHGALTAGAAARGEEPQRAAKALPEAESKPDERHGDKETNYESALH